MERAAEAVSARLPQEDGAAWLRGLSDVASRTGHYRVLGPRHFAAYVEAGSTLLVTFESRPAIRSRHDAKPLGWIMVRRAGWSHLALVSESDTWFRDPAVYDYFDAGVDSGFFDGFDQVIFQGAGPGGYAACAFSVAAPGARVVAIQPQATLDPGVAIWDDRFEEMRRTSFTDRYGYAPDMLDAADQAWVLYDPAQTLDAMHAALFTRPNVTKLRMRRMGAQLQGDLLQMGALPDLLALAERGALDPLTFARLLRGRREHQPYLRRLLSAVDTGAHPALTAALCRNVSTRMDMPRFARRLEALERRKPQETRA